MTRFQTCFSRKFVQARPAELSVWNFILSTLKLSEEFIPNGLSFEMAHLVTWGYWPLRTASVLVLLVKKRIKLPNFKATFFKSFCKFDPEN